ncbi:putative short chain oxidoreductase/dehydrogenase [Daldinia decipiens]|uniref:putative short chain oxidoreductase/dehydrogenase n=1 Tax=Daldinia decipiens TaxID=326647 RepID=UPI0020C3BF96|nr:putative short chain oxidoreductase/dehydrogenase [Daldinia decipiens]KAI1658248.1 putative short chain oxidoreductase/dehydrogenase [Daldinia decipiens]
MAEKQVWLVTGASRGLGLDIARTALKAGHTVIAGYRNKAKTPAFAEIEALGGTWLQLEMAGDDVESQVQSVVALHGKIDVLINNAGWIMLGSIEDTDFDHIDSIFRTNFLGPLRTIKAVLPSMRARRSGTIINVSSSSTLEMVPGLGIYAATKFALGGITETLQAEVAAFNIRTLLVIPGNMDTEAREPSGAGVHLPLSETYKGTVLEQVEQFLLSPASLDSASKPAAVAQRIIEAVDGTGVFFGKKLSLVLPLGKDTSSSLEKRAAMYQDLVKDTKEVSESV